MSKKIETLTKEQEAMIPVYLEEFRKIGLSTEPCDRVKAEKAITDSYLYQKRKAPHIFWVDSPYQGAILAAHVKKKSKNVTEQEVKDQAGMASYASFEAYWGSFYCYIAEQLPVKKDELASIVRAIMENCGVYWTFDNVVIVSEKPTVIKMKDEKLHNEDGLALEYKDGNGIFALNGVKYPSLLEMTIEKEMKKK